MIIRRKKYQDLAQELKQYMKNCAHNYCNANLLIDGFQERLESVEGGARDLKKMLLNLQQHAQNSWYKHENT